MGDCPMDDVIKRIVAELLKTIGFEAVESKALELLVNVLDDRITSYLNTVSKMSLLCSRPTTTLLDLFGMRQRVPWIGKELRIPNDALAECGVLSTPCRSRTVQSLFTLVPLKKQHFPVEMAELEESWVSPLSTRVEKFIHIYEFMPEFPPIHTFRMSLMKGSTVKNQSSKVKNRLEQSLRSEGNMVKLIKSSGSMPKFVNYLYKGRTS